MVEIKIKGSTPMEALSALTAFGMRCMQNTEIGAAASRILNAEELQEQKQAVTARSDAEELRKLKKTAAAQNGAEPPRPEIPAAESGPGDGAPEPTAAPENQPEPEPAPTPEVVRAKGIEASRRYGKEAVVALLKKYGASGMSALAEKDRAPFLADLKGLDRENA